MKSALDTHDYEADPYSKPDMSPVKGQAPVTLNCRKTRAAKVSDLGSDILGTGCDTM